MSGARLRIADFLEQDVKSAVKRIYKPPLIELARLWRARLGRTRFIGITGSAGKTTTKDLLHAALARRHRAVKSDDSNNQLYSVARTILATGSRADFCVQEVGLARPNEIRRMAELLAPHVGIVTNIGQDHWRNFRSSEAIAAEKGRLIECLPSSGFAILNADDPLVAVMGRRTSASVVSFGLGPGAEFRGEVLEARFPEPLALEIRHGERSTRIDTRLSGAHHAVSVLAAFAAAVSVGVVPEDAAAGISACEASLGRLLVQRTARGVTFVRDDLKAPEWSLGAALRFVTDAHASRKLVVIGTLSDYPGDSRRTYRRAVEAAFGAADHVLLVGDRADRRAQRWQSYGPGRLHGFTGVRAAADWLKAFAQDGDLVLLKGSITADHLARIALSFDHEVGCWRNRCPRNLFCDHCRWLRFPADP